MFAKSTPRLEVVCGPMFSGKSEELIRRIKRASIAKRPYFLFKPDIDNRYSLDHVASHSGVQMACQPVKAAKEITKALEDAEPCLIGIDECQFLGDEVVEVVKHLLKRGFRIVVAGLDLDSQKEPFMPMPTLMAMADTVDKLTAVCARCGDDAVLTFRTAAVEDKVFVGAGNKYEARCRKHWGKSWVV